MAFAFSVEAQNTRVDGNASTAVRTYLDTLTNADTVVNTCLDLTYPYNYHINVVADSLSGTTTGTFKVEHRLYGGNVWKTLSTVTIDGVQTTPAAITGNVPCGALRFTSITSGTQSLKVDCEVALIRKSQ
ncbi:MAG: hypothetical protein IPM42_22170 [Saprospiraceae bacterium]|nr:hypothetical protein [Saprospiraceae bacterium]